MIEPPVGMRQMYAITGRPRLMPYRGAWFCSVLGRRAGGMGRTPQLAFLRWAEREISQECERIPAYLVAQLHTALVNAERQELVPRLGRSSTR